MQFLLFVTEIPKSGTVFFFKQGCSGSFDVVYRHLSVPLVFSIDQIDVPEKFEKGKVTAFILVVDFTIRYAGIGFVYDFFNLSWCNCFPEKFFNFFLDSFLGHMYICHFSQFPAKNK